MKKILIYIFLVGTVLYSCKKDGTNVVMSSSPVAPTITTMPNLTLVRANGTNTLKFVGTPVNPGFHSSANYYLEAAAAGTSFASPILILTDVQDTSLKITISDLNGLLLKKFPADQVSSVDFRIRAVLVVDAGTGAPGTSTKPFQYTSPVKNANVTIYGLPRLDLIGSGLTQKIESALGDGKYKGYVKLDVTKPFTLKDPDANIVYGDNAAALKVNGNPIAVPSTSGWYLLNADTKALTYNLTPYMIGLIGDATPNGWSSPDTKMDYDSQSGLWYVTVALTANTVKIRKNDTWGDINLGCGDDTHTQYTSVAQVTSSWVTNQGVTVPNLWNDGGSKNIPILQAGNYTVKVSIGTSAYSCTITKN